FVQCHLWLLYSTVGRIPAPSLTHFSFFFLFSSSSDFKMSASGSPATTASTTAEKPTSATAAPAPAASHGLVEEKKEEKKEKVKEKREHYYTKLLAGLTDKELQVVWEAYEEMEQDIASGDPSDVTRIIRLDKLKCTRL